MKLSKRLNNFKEYPFSKYQKIIAEIEKKTKKKVLSFGMGNPDHPPSSKYLKEFQNLILEKDNHLYPGFGAKEDFSVALINWYKKRFAVSLTDDEIFPLLGAKDGVGHLPLAILDKGDEVLVPNPGYPTYTGGALMVNAKPVYYNLSSKNDFKPNIDELEKKVTSKTKFIWVNFPSNPCGQVADKDDLEILVDFAKKHEIWLIYDNAYSEICFDKFVAPSILEIKKAKEIALEIGSFSKSCSFAGYRIGWVAGNKHLINALSQVKSQIDSGLSLHLQRLGAYALNKPDKKWQRGMLKSYQNRRDIIASKLDKLGLEFNLPKGGLYIWARIPKSYKDSEKFSMKILKEKNVFFTPGTAFGTRGKSYVRVSFCVNIDNIEDYL